jgi:holo-[acyl-carrier protein] synthase
MILGIGTDIVEVVRMETMIDEHGNSFIEKIFTEDERKESEKRKDRAQYFAGRWAAKEALSKALGCGFGAQCGWKDITILNTSNGKPELTLTGTALRTSQKLGGTSIHLSISHEKHYACASVVIEKD